MPDALPGWPRGLPAELAASYLGISLPTLLRQVKAGAVPAPVRVSPGRVVWLREQLDAYLDRRAGLSVASAGVAPWSN